MNINKPIYEGYLWYSNAQSPQVIDKEEFELTINDNHNPFIVEGQLCDVHNRHSISIKFVYSNAQSPQVIDKEEFELTIDDNHNPFIVEGQLCDVHNRHSISIKFVDGQYIIKEYDFTEDDFSKPEIEVKTFLSNRMGGKKLQFLQYWKAEPDPLCEHMEVLQSAELVFVGFKTKEDKL